MRTSLSTVRRRLDALARRNECSEPHTVSRVVWRDEYGVTADAVTEPDQVCRCGRAITETITPIGWIPPERGRDDVTSA